MRLPIGIVYAIGATIAPPATARDTKAWDTSGSVARDVLVVTALALPAAKGDWKGDLQALASIGGAFVVTTALKQTIKSRRPDDSDQHSFPSGHSSASFAAAATLHNRYGWKIGLPAQAVAVFVGVSRVQARRHRWGDVLAGAAIGEASGLLLTRKLNDNVRVVPWGDTRSGGVSVALRF